MAILNDKLKELAIVEESLAKLNRKLNVQKDKFE